MIRKAETKDIAVLTALIDEFYHTDAVHAPIPLSYCKRAAESAVRADFPFTEAYLFEENGEAKGYAQVSLGFSAEGGGLQVWIEDLYVRAAYRGQGIGNLFFRTLFDEYEGRAMRFRLEVAPDNAGASRMYSRLGFEPLGYRQMVLDVSGSGEENK